MTVALLRHVDTRLFLNNLVRFSHSTACTCCAEDSHEMALQLLPLTSRQFGRLSSELHTYKEIQPGSAPLTHAASSFTLPSSLIICICHTSLTVLLQQNKEGTSAHKRQIFIKAKFKLCLARYWFCSLLFEVLGKKLGLILRPRPPKGTWEGNVYSQLGDTESHAIKIGKLGRILGRHFTRSFYLGSQITQN